MLTFEQAEAALTPEQRSQLAHCLLESKPLPAWLSEEQKVFYFGLSVLCEYESRNEVEKYLL